MYMYMYTNKHVLWVLPWVVHVRASLVPRPYPACVLLPVHWGWFWVWDRYYVHTCKCTYTGCMCKAAHSNIMDWTVRDLYKHVSEPCTTWSSILTVNCCYTSVFYIGTCTLYISALSPLLRCVLSCVTLLCVRVRRKRRRSSWELRRHSNSSR